MDFDRAKSALSGTRFPDLRHVSETGSTNADVSALLTAAPPGFGGHVVLVADHQTKGRGRLDRSWEAPPGASILMTLGMPLGPVVSGRTGLLTMALSLATLDAIRGIGVDALRLKWPNDVVLPIDPSTTEIQGSSTPTYRKMGGILAELVHTPTGAPAAVIGMGLNINWGSMPEHLAATAVSLDELTGTEVDRWDLVQRVVDGFDATWLPLVEADDPTPLVTEYTGRSATIGSAVRVELPDGTVTGIATGVTSIGALIVATEEGTMTITAGDVVHLRPIDPL